MNLENEFDELAKRKLQEQAFPFEEAHWLDAQRLIAAEKRSRASQWWRWATGGIALLALLWWLWPTTEIATLATNESAPVAQGTAATSNDAVESRTAEQAEEEKPEVSAQGLGGNPTTASQEPTTTMDAPTEAASSERGESNAHRNTASKSWSTNQQPRSDAARSTPSGTTASAPAKKDRPTAQDQHTSGTPDQGPTTGPASEPAPMAVVVTATMDGTTTNGSAMQPGTQATSAASATTTQPQGATTGLEPALVMATSTSGDAADIVAPKSDGSTANEPVSNPTSSVPTAGDSQDALPNISTTPAATTGTAVTDSTTAMAPTGEPNDSTAMTNTAAINGAPPVPVPPQPPIAPSPWELGVLGGFFQSTSSYSGGTSAAWEVSPEQNVAFGAEAMHLGRNFGWGSGLHYGTFADRLYTPAEDRSTITYTPFWQLVPVDTSILIITGNYTDTATGELVYIGQHVDVTVNVLRRALDSTFAAVRIREARERINRTSYVEIPFLLDAHVTQGRWSLGVRGGPTVGLLTQRSGSVPSENEERNFNDVAMRTWMFGWTARAYVRYRFNSAWSVGIEPTARGQLFDSFEENGITRRSNAYGVMLSLSYRLK